MLDLKKYFFKISMHFILHFLWFSYDDLVRGFHEKGDLIWFNQQYGYGQFPPKYLITKSAAKLF